MLGAIRRTPACRPLCDFGSRAPHVARRPARPVETARQALRAVEEAWGAGPAGHGGLRAAWLARLRSLVRRNVLKDASPAARDGSAIGSGRQEELDGDVRRMPAEVRATLRQSERAWGLQGLQSAARELG